MKTLIASAVSFGLSQGTLWPDFVIILASALDRTLDACSAIFLYFISFSPASQSVGISILDNSFMIGNCLPIDQLMNVSET